MQNYGSLQLKYVMWGQKIWNPSRDALGPWTGWRDQSPKDRGGNTNNHWYVPFDGCLLGKTFLILILLHVQGIMFMSAMCEL